jgi:hypothetical protein
MISSSKSGLAIRFTRGSSGCVAVVSEGFTGLGGAGGAMVGRSGVVQATIANAATNVMGLSNFFILKKTVKFLFHLKIG